MTVSRETSAASVRDVGRLPPPRDTKRRARYELDFPAWCREYLKHWFHTPFSETQFSIARSLGLVIVRGGQIATELDRGCGATTLIIAAALFATLNGHRRYVVLLADRTNSSVHLIDTLKAELVSNVLLQEDYPEVCVPLRLTGGISARARAQTYLGQPTLVELSSRRLVLPTIDGSQASGRTIYAQWCRAGLCGLAHRGYRPDLVLVDRASPPRELHAVFSCKTSPNVFTILPDYEH